MNIERLTGGTSGSPFPVYENLVPSLLAAHGSADNGRDAVVAHVLGTCSGFAYADLETVAMIAARLGLEDCACVRIGQIVDAMHIFSTAFLVQSRCGRAAILCYRGTEPANLGNWLTDADVGSGSIALGGEMLVAHAGMLRNVRSTLRAVLDELHLALQGRSLRDPRERVEYPLEALYVGGHSLGGAMALLFALCLAESAEHRGIAGKLRAIYTFGQPLVTGEPLPEAAREVGRKLYRHVNARDLVPSLPPSAWGHLAHFGREYRYAEGEWRQADVPVTQVANFRKVPGAVLALLGTAKRRGASRYTMDEHGPHHYIAALRPKGRPDEFGDPG